MTLSCMLHLNFDQDLEKLAWFGKISKMKACRSQVQAFFGFSPGNAMQQADWARIFVA